MTTWTIDPAHSSVLFQTRHLVVARVNGRFERVTGSLELDPEALTSAAAKIEIDASSVNTNNPERDNHLRSDDFLGVATAPKLMFRSVRVEPVVGSTFRLHGELTLRNVTRPVVLESKLLGALRPDPWGNQRVIFNAKGTVNRTEFGIGWNQKIADGGWLVSEKVEVEIDLQAISPVTPAARH